MSHSTLFVFPEDGIAQEVTSFRNSHGTGPFVWTALVEKHLPNENLMMLAWPKLWDEVKARTVTLTWWEHNTLFFTYDNAMVKGRDLPILSRSLRRFQTQYGNPKRVCHLAAIADEIDKLMAPVPLSVGLWVTDLSDNPWCFRRPEEDDSEPYNLHKGDKHWFVEVQDGS